MKKFTDKINESFESNNLPTAEEFFTSVVGENPDEFNGYIKECMIEFAKLHVEAALKEVSKKAVLTDEVCDVLQEHWFDEYIDKDSILNAYPLDKIN
jgi:hypothetical protein